MSFYYVLVISGFFFLTVSALLGLAWAIRHGEFRNLSKASLLIFDDEEPVGKMTDFFPGQAQREEGRQLPKE
jgi:hypothetical protein